MCAKLKVAVVGGGITGITAARMLFGKAEVIVYEASDRIGGLIRCDDLPEGLYHRVGGHVFNSKSTDVSSWFWRFFDRDAEFRKITRNAQILMNGAMIGYPIENHIYQLPQSVGDAIISDLLATANRRSEGVRPASTLKEFVETTFGKTLCELYFLPYNAKIWRQDLGSIPLEWLEGKLPMPTAHEIVAANVYRTSERKMVHSEFFYPRMGGSQFVIERLASGLNIRHGDPVRRIERLSGGGWIINGDMGQAFDWVIYTGDIRKFSAIFPSADQCSAFNRVQRLSTRGISNVFCECDHTDISWLYLPEPRFAANRIIYTGGFSPGNNRGARMTCVVEFAYDETDQRITQDLRDLPGRLRPIAYNRSKDAYVVQMKDTRSLISEIKAWGRGLGLLFNGRFSEWEYYNIDKCIESSAESVRALGIDPYQAP